MAMSLFNDSNKRIFSIKWSLGKWKMGIVRKSQKAKIGRFIQVSHSTSTARSNIHVKKVLLCICWDFKGIIYYELFKLSETSEYCQQKLIHLSNEIEHKSPFIGNGTRQVILLHDNVRPHMSKATLELIYFLSWQWNILHATYSSDLASTDHHLFRSLQSFMSISTNID